MHRSRPHTHRRYRRRLAQAALPICMALLAACGQANHPAVLDEGSIPTPAESRVETVDLRTKAPAAEAQEVKEVAAALGDPMGEFNMTYYWIAAESKKSKGNQVIVDKKCKKIARVSKHFKKRLTLEGSGKLKDGRLVTTAGGCKCGGPCFWVADEKFPWGAGVAQRPLTPFRSIAVDPKKVKIGSSLYVAELDGLTMPGAGDTGGFVHDGCVVADDRGGGVRGKQIDFFAAQRGHYKNFFKRHKINKVSVFAGGERCQDHAEEHDSKLLAVRGSS